MHFSFNILTLLEAKESCFSIQSILRRSKMTEIWGQPENTSVNHVTFDSAKRFTLFSRYFFTTNC